MTVQEALDKFIQVVQDDEYHKNYERTKEVGKFAYSTCTGDEIADLVTSVRMRETERMKQQRMRITKPLSPAAVEMVKKYYRKLRKTDGLKRGFDWQGDDPNKKSELAGAISMFYAGQSASEYLFDVLEDYTFLDPNAFLIIERENIYDETGRLIGVQVFPVEYSCNEIRHYEYRRGLLDWLLIEQKIAEKTGGASYTVSEFRLYGSGFVLHAVEYKEKAPQKTGTGGAPYVNISINVGSSRMGRESSRHFLYFIYMNGTLEVPAIRLGAYLDGRTTSTTAVTPMEPARPLVESLINIGSLHDLTVFLHSIPRRRELVEACDYEDRDTGFQCENGYLNGNVSQACPRCKGTGDKSINSEQDMIRIILPQNFAPADLPDLSRFAYTESADVALLDWQQGKLDWLMKFIVYAVMTRDAVTMAEVAKTATELVLNNQDAYDKMQPYAELFSQAWKLIVRITAQYLEIYDGLRVYHSFPDDFQFETEDQLIDKRQKAVSAGAPYPIIRNIDKQIIRKQTKSEEEAMRIAAWEKWKPWPDLNDEMIALIIADRKPTDPDRMLRENFARVQREVEEGTAGAFYLMSYEGQRDLIDGKLAELIETIQFRDSQPADFGEFNLMQ